MKRATFLAAATIFLGLSASWLYAGGDKDKEWKQKTWKVPKEQYSLIKAVNPVTNTVSIHHVGGKIGQDRELTVTTFSEIIVDGKRTTLASLKVGMHVDYTLGGDGSVAARIETRQDQAPPPTPVPTATPSFPGANRNK